MDNYTPFKMPITAWAEADRPREKLMTKGRQHLTDAELIAILLGSGSRDETAVSLAQRMLNQWKNNLNSLGKASIAELQKGFKGIGDAKAITIAAALELGRRRQLADPEERVQIRSSRDAYNALASVLLDLPHEEFWLLFLNRASKVIGKKQVGIGGTTGVVVDAKIVFRHALENNAVQLVLAHNHPSGNLFPSEADILLTQKLKKAGKMLDILILDHLIIGDGDYYSFGDEGTL